MTLIVATVMATGAIGAAFLSADSYLAWAAVSAWPVFFYSIFRPQASTIAAKAAVGALSVAAAIAYPLYAVLLVGGFLATRLFFHWRFGIAYPTFV